VFLTPLLAEQPSMKTHGRLAVLILLAVAAADSQAQGERWPPLPKEGFVAGRAATQADVVAGRAVFVPESGGVSVGKPLRITIPQYAYYREGKNKTPAIVIQAEEALGLQLVGARLADGRKIVGPLPNFELLGKVPPTK
jgi:hypothetical protein